LKAPTQPKTSEQLEMEKINYFRKELTKKRKIAEESCKLALSSKSACGPMAIKPPTQPKEFKFETDSRIKAHPPAPEIKAPKAVSGIKMFADCRMS